jgi:hypothetical protein
VTLFVFSERESDAFLPSEIGTAGAAWRFLKSLVGGMLVSTLDTHTVCMGACPPKPEVGFPNIG